jgi:Zn-dependent peptidase ImmA (M78 family)
MPRFPIGMKAAKNEKTPEAVPRDADFPCPPETLPAWALEEAKPWWNLDDFDLLVYAERACGRMLELKKVPLTDNLWGLHVARGDRARIYVNSLLPPFWQRFACFHELYHLLFHPRGESFWARTATPLSSFEYQADLFAWACMLPEWQEAQ